jgi:hypothetical protein
MRPDVLKACVLQDLAQLRHRYSIPRTDVDAAEEDDLGRQRLIGDMSA